MPRKHRWKKRQFNLACETLKEAIEPVSALRFAVQTNGMLIDDEWVDLFHKHQVYASISLDGPKAINDVQRVDHDGNSTYDRSIAGLRRLQRAYDDGLVPMRPGILCVIDPLVDGGDVYRHFVDDLGVTSMDFLLPDMHVDEASEEHVLGVGEYLTRVFHQWTRDNDPDIQVRIFTSQIRVLLGRNPSFIGFAGDVRNALAFTVGSGGAIHVDDTLRSTNHEVFSEIGNVRDTSLQDVLRSRQLRMLRKVTREIAPACQDCIWRHPCSGGRAVNRYSPENGFDNPSVYCGALRKMYSECVAFLVRSGVPIDDMEQRLQAPTLHAEMSNAAWGKT